MQRTRIKFCGITRVQDALAAARAGADAVGMVLFSNTARRIPLALAKQIVDALPPFVTPVGLFVDAPLEFIQRATDECHIRHAQLHGQESPAMVAELKKRSVIKALQVSGALLPDDLKQWKDVENLTGILLETASSEHAGGSGIENDWQAIHHAQEAGHFNSLPPIIAAGGLNRGNVADVVRLLHPWAVDVSSGIESSLGIKWQEKMEAFVDAVRSADSM